MKKYYIIVFALALGLLNSCSNTTEPVADADPTGFYKIDVKSSYTNKYTATAAKNGLIGYMRLKGAKWCIDNEIGEDYSFWIKNVRSTNLGDSTILRYDLELRTPALITEGNFIASHNGSVITYYNNPDFDKEGMMDEKEISAYIKNTLERNVTISKQAIDCISSLNLISGDAIKGVLNFFLNFFASDSKIKRSQIEGAMTGSIIFAEMRTMIKENIEVKKK